MSNGKGINFFSSKSIICKHYNFNITKSKKKKKKKKREGEREKAADDLKAAVHRDWTVQTAKTNISILQN